MNSKKHTAKHDAVEHFNHLADTWWDLQGPLKTLHEINPFRLQYIMDRCALSGQATLDVGCGGGILSEALALHGAQVTGLDLAPNSIEAAKAHAQSHGLSIDYQCVDVASWQGHIPIHVLTCMELLEHVDDPKQLIKDCVKHCASGADLFFSTINRTPKAFVFAILGAEYITGLIPKGTHHYAQFIKPSELASWLQAAGAKVQHVQGFHYAAITKEHRLCDDVSINYMLHAKKE